MYVFNRITVNPQLPKKNRKTIRNSKQPMVVMEHRIFKTIQKNRQRLMGKKRKKTQ